MKIVNVCSNFHGDGALEILRDPVAVLAATYFHVMKLKFVNLTKYINSESIILD